jgi:hypothetical protein
MSQQTQINGNRYSFTSIAVRAGNQDIPRGVFMSIDYDAEQDPGVVEGNQIVPVGLTSGYARGSGSFEMLVSELDDFFAAITNTPNGTIPIMSADFDIAVSYSVNNGVDVRTDTLRGCRIKKIGSPNKKGTDATTKTCDLFIRRVQLNGIDAFLDPGNA